MGRQNIWDYLKLVLIAVGIVGLFSVLALFLWAIADVLLLLFTGVLFAIILRTIAKPLVHYTPLTDKWALAVVLLLLVLFLVIGGWLFIPEVISQTDQLVAGVREAINRIEAIINQNPWTQRLFGGLFVDNFEQFPLPNNIMPRLTGTFTGTLRTVSHLLFILFIGLFVAIDPELYRNGIIQLIPPQGRKRARQVIDKTVHQIRSWLLGQFISMLIIGIVTGVGLWIMGIPLALVLGFLSGILEFVPIVGPIISAVPPILIAFTIGLNQAIYVALFFLVVQQLEGNLLTPIVQQKVVSLPPALTLTAVLVMAVLFGPVGVLVATPITVVIFILVKMLYLEDVLGSAHQHTRYKDLVKK